MKIIFHCMFCQEKDEVEVETAFVNRYDAADLENSFVCPNHAGVIPFLKNQCPGCVGGFPDCGLARSFMYSGSRDITRGQLATIALGTCPFRVNGTIMTSPETGVTEIDLSEPSPHGRAMVDAIKEYIERYPGDAA